MNFQQLKIIRETARCHFNLTEVANTLYTSQSGVSRHIKELEDELGVELFIRRGKRLLGMTEPGKARAAHHGRTYSDEANNIRRLADNFANSDRGRLCLYHPYAGSICVTGHHQRVPHAISASTTGAASGQPQ